jgi:pectate lyase
VLLEEGIKMSRTTFLVGFVVLLFWLALPVFAADGWASMNGGTTGGQGGTVVDVNNATDLEYYAELGTTPYIIQISGTIDIGTGILEISANKTLRGIGENPTLVGNVDFKNRDGNIIVENLNITNPHVGSQYDGMSVTQDIHNVLITKCTFYDCGDGCLDITNNSDYVTVSWCKFYYTSDTTHNFVNLVGASDTQEDDANNLRVTFHHNWWTTMCKERMPRVRYGQVHVYNNYYSNLMAGGYCIGVGCGSRIRVENNYFNAVPNPWKNYYTAYPTHPPGHIGWNTGNVFYNCSVPTWATNEYSTIFTPPYDYTLDDAADIPDIVQAYAGAGTPYPPHWYYTVYGDFDKDGVVETDDLKTFADYWLDTTDIDDADRDGDGNVNFYEFALLAQNWLEN